MFPTGHLAVSLVVGGGLWAATGSPWAMAGSVVAGVLVDGDHVLDYANALRGDIRRILVPLHSYELGLAGLLAAFLTGWHPLLTGAALGLLAHVASDALTNRLHPLAYFLAYRVRHGFRRAALALGSEEEAWEEMVRTPGVGWLLRRVGRWTPPEEAEGAGAARRRRGAGRGAPSRGRRWRLLW